MLDVSRPPKLIICMHSVLCSKLAYKLLVKAHINPHLQAMGGSSQGWAKMWQGPGHPIHIVQLGVRRIKELDRVNMWGTIDEACQVLHRNSPQSKWKQLGFFHVYPLYAIKIGGDPPGVRQWTLFNGLYYHSDPIPQHLIDAYIQHKKAKKKEEMAYIEEKRKRVEDAFVQHKRLCIQPGEFKLVISDSVPSPNTKEQTAPRFEHHALCFGCIQAGGA